MKPRLSIGIAAYNEEVNIKKLIDALLTQHFERVELAEIIVVSDASEDTTDELVRSVSDNRVRLIRNAHRLGQDGSQNIIANEAWGDILIQCDADILPADANTCEVLIEPILEKNISIVSSILKPFPPKNYIEKVLVYSHTLKDCICQQINAGDNVYRCHGPMRAFSKKLYKDLVYADNCPTDAFSYLFAKKYGYKFYCNNEARVLFKVPGNLPDHFKQSSRFNLSKKSLGKYFGKETIDREYFIPVSKLFPCVLRELVNHPILFTSFCLISLYCRMRGWRKNSSFTSLWEVVHSSKPL